MTGPDRSPPLQAVAIVLILVTITSFCLRSYVRLHMVKAFGLDDWFMLAAAICYILFATVVLIGVHYGTGRLSTDISAENYSKAMQYWLYCYIWYCWTMIFSKISIGIFLLRIIVEKVHLWLIYVALFINVLSGLAFFLVTLLQCHPVSYFWNKAQDGACINVDIIIALTYLYSSLNIICDFTFALLPIVIVQGLNMNRKLKIAIIPLLSMGCIASSAVVVRLAYVERFRSSEYLYETTDIAIWSTVEAGLAVTAGSLACIRPLFKIMMQRIGWNSDAYFHPLFSRSDDVDAEDGSADNHSVGSASTTKLVGPGGIMKTSAFTVKVEEREPAPPAPVKHADGGPSDGTENLGRMR
ncbi:hypothetical protein VSDG_01278 [Cytospora chrysosperma]|uniref:Rhodopsin domain-containing protein n=1 Tax=Cytospora chrysosperma TaxID=252740 RepID=A0A423WJD1_CYTCH|nr:hypothetical protein VSDG_01278 [Valsa sordida]